MSGFRREKEVPGPTGGRSDYTTQVVYPLGGFSPTGSELLAKPDSLISGQNVWVRYGVLEPRWKLSAQSVANLNTGLIPNVSNVTNPQSTGQRCMGVVPFVNPSDAAGTAGARGVTWVSGNTNSLAISYYSQGGNQLGWFQFSKSTRESYASVSTFVEPSLHTNANWRGAVVYSAPLNYNLMVLAAGNAPKSSAELLMATSAAFRATVPPGPANVMNYSRLSGVTPTAIDVTNFGNRIVAWNCDGVPQRVQWHIEGDPTDWTGIGSGTQDLTDMNGYGTRIFPLEDEMILASSEEIWRGRSVGLPYVFSFTPVNRQIGMPYERATLQTPFGIIWLGRNFVVYRMVGEQITELTEVGQYMQAYLRDNLKAPDTAFFVYNQVLNQIRLFYSVMDNAYPTRSIAYDIDDEVWTDESYGHYFQCGISTPIITSSAVTGGVAPVWDGNQYPVGLYAAAVTSVGTFGSYSLSANSDMGTDCDEDGLTGPFTSDAAFHKYLLEEARYDIGAVSASSLTVGWSRTFGNTVAVSERLNVSGSGNSQIITYPKMTGQYWTLRLQSTNASWQLRRIATKMCEDGEQR